MKSMTKLKLLLLIVLTIASMVNLSAQTKRPVYVGISAHALNLNNDVSKDTWQWTPGPAKLTVGVPFGNHFTLLPTASFGAVTVPSTTSNSTFWNVDANIAYSPFGKDKIFEPYLMVGIGATRLNASTYGAANGGVGFNIWITDGFALTAQGNYNYLNNNYASTTGTNNKLIKQQSYWQMNYGILFKIGGGPRDSDKDGVPDEEDPCPKVKGPIATHGCPDTDGDGVADKDDACPNEAGTAATQGCPDRDGDGIADAQDKCPDQRGTVANGGCPDTDGDGILDKDDACPSEKGTAANKGCPDRDGDGIVDSKDACPDQAGPAATNGCPDRDGDGVIDKMDACPDQPGVASNRGCPEINVEEVNQKLSVSAKEIQFKTGLAVITQSSFDDLDVIIGIMNQYPQSRFRVEGHTDNAGKAASNLALSDRRAAAVKDYLTTKGIASSRLESVGYGKDRPIATNATAAGRAANRRVEVHLIQ